MIQRKKDFTISTDTAEVTQVGDTLKLEAKLLVPHPLCSGCGKGGTSMAALKNG